MTEYTSHFNNDLLFKRTLNNFGIEADCSFEMLRQCSMMYDSTPADTPVQRWHDDIIKRLVKCDDSLIDLGCGDGELMARLSYECNCWLQGVEINEDLVNRCVERGLPVCHGDLSDILNVLPDKSYTWAVLEDTLFTLKAPLDVLNEMLRVADKCIVTFPNFAHWSVRFTFSLGGRMPVTKSLPHTWYNTPNIHLLTINDFFDFCKKRDIKIEKAIYCTKGRKKKSIFITTANFFSEEAIFLIRK